MTKGRYGIHGGQYIPETLMNAVFELEEAYNHYKNDKEFDEKLYRKLIKQIVVYKDDSVRVIFPNNNSIKIGYRDL